MRGIGGMVRADGGSARNEQSLTPTRRPAAEAPSPRGRHQRALAELTASGPRPLDERLSLGLRRQDHIDHDVDVPMPQRSLRAHVLFPSKDVARPLGVPFQHLSAPEVRGTRFSLRLVPDNFRLASARSKGARPSRVVSGNESSSVNHVGVC